MLFQKKDRRTVSGSSEAKHFPSMHKARDSIPSAAYKDEIKFDCINNYTKFWGAWKLLNNRRQSI